MAVSYPVNDIHPGLFTLGRHAGTPVIFVQLQGCDVKCHWCNVPETWQLHTEPYPDWKRPLTRWNMATADEIVAACKAFRQKRVIITGGEPLLHDVVPLLVALQAAGYTTQLETSGTHAPPSEQRGTYDTQLWLTVSPKLMTTRALDMSALWRANEIVFPILDRWSLSRLQREVIPHVSRHTPIFLHVLGGPRLISQATAAAFQYNYHLTGFFAKDAVA